ncbi:ATP-binding SpoIIE family protein phosphatase [Streptomyces chartreusis]
MSIAQDLVDTLVPDFGDLANVELAEAVLVGDEPPRMMGGGEMHWRRVAVASESGQWPMDLLQPGQAIPRLPDSSTVRNFQRGDSVMMADRIGVTTALKGDPALIKALLPDAAKSMVAAPLFARDLVLGNLVVWRTDRYAPFDQEDADLLSEIAAWAALTVDNARRYTREHRTATALQRRLLPKATTNTRAAETAGSYAPASGGAEIGGDWFDVLPLPSLRVAMVMGDVLGHGLHATATMGRLRAAVQTLADLELEPDELLTRVDNLVQHIVAEAPPGLRDTVGASCLYAAYDPVTGRCSLASAGHPPPLLFRPDGTTELIDVEPGPPLGVGGMPFEVTTVEIEPESILALYTDGLTMQEHHDPGLGTQQLADKLTAHVSDRQYSSLQDIGDSVLRSLARIPPRDDMTLLLARIRRMPEDSSASWNFEADPAVISEARKMVARQLAHWNLDDLNFTTEMIVSELLTNAVRYGGPPITVRLLRDTVLVCEVSDGSNTSPRLLRARSMDEGGRGLFLVAQLSQRWGSRYGRSGKTIWAEQHLTSTHS